ncbi:MAG: hypothetical protein HOJ34_01005 [Kordiimonadaceae bacterium]|jgi:hypothetical protein|nr:hypothetical protein [Kordiimonadaceae bacterium]MBT6031880.1 hypothetical protein [Kordiimonadaceae bacterium]MBT6328335.1 hypothetical protein [Kordiimonadaceae bacterium]
MSNIDDIPQDVTPDQLDAALIKFVVTVEEEIAIHHDHPEWMDLDEECVEEKNLIVRAGLILSMLDEGITLFSIPEQSPTVKRIRTAQDYFSKLKS